MTAHNFGYVGSGQDFTNDPSLAIQNNEVEELNGGKVLFSSTDQDGDFRVGDAFSVDQETGNVSFAATSTAQSAANITLSDATGTTNIFPAYIETGNLRIAGNSVTSTTGQVIVDPSGQEDFVVNAETIVKEAIYFDVNKSISFGSTVQGALKIGGFGGSTVFGSSEASNFSTRSFVVLKNGIGTVNIDGAGTGYSGGTQPTEIISDPFQKATVQSAIATTGSIKTITINTRGSGYTTQPTVVFSAGTATGNAVLANGGRCESIDILDGGTGYSASPTVTISEAPQIAFSANNIAIIIADNTLTLTAHPFETGDAVLFDSSTIDATAVAPTGLTDQTTYYIIRVDNDTIKFAASLSDANSGNAINITAEGSGSMFIKGTDATVGAITVSAGAITAIAVATKGSGYLTAPTVTITDSSGTGAIANGIHGRGIDEITLTDLGSYAVGNAPTISFTLGTGDTTGSGASATATLGFPLASVTLLTNGLGYRNIPTVTISGNPTTEATITPVLDEQTARITSLTLDVPGEGFETNPTILLVGGGGKNATAAVDIQSVAGNITSSGSGYAPGTYTGVEFTGGSPTTIASADFTIPGLQGTITNGGSGYLNATDAYSVTFRNAPTTTYTLTAVTRAKIEISSVTGTFAVGNTVTGSGDGQGNGGGSGTITVVTATYIYLSNVTGDFVSGLETISNGSGASATVSTYTSTLNRFLVNGNEGVNITLTDDNTYRLDTSDASLTSHPVALGTSVTGLVGRQYRSIGTAGSYYEIVVGPSVSSEGTNSYINCTSHGQTMIEPGEILFTTGTAGQSGTNMQANATVSGGAVTAIEITSQGENVKLNDVLIIEDDDLGSQGGSGFQYTINSNNTGITAVTNISLTGAGYQVGDVLSVDDANVGSGGGSGFQFTTNQVGFASAVSMTTGGEAFELADVLILGTVGGTGVAQGTGLALSIATLNPVKSLELTQAGDLTLGETGGDQVAIRPDGSISAANWNINATGTATLVGLTSSGNVSITGTLSVTSTSTLTGLATFNGGITVSGADSSIDRANIKILDGSAAAPSLTFSDTGSNTTGFFKSDTNKIGVTFSGTEGVRLDGSNYIDTKGIQVDSVLGNVSPFFKVETTTPKLNIGTSAANIAINNATTISTEGTDVDVPLTLDTKGGGDFTFKGGADVDFIVDDGTTEVFKLETSTGTATFSGNLDAGKLRVRQNVVANNSSAAVRSFGEVITLTVTGTGSGYTDGTYTQTATTSTGGGTGLTVDVTVASGTFSSVVVYDKGQNYAIGDEITITAAGGGTGLTITVSDIDGQGVVLKPSAGKDILCDTTGSLVIPSGTTNQRPTALDRVTGAIRFNSSQLQFEGFNGSDFVSLGGVRDVDQDTFVLTEVSPGSDEDTFEFFNVGVNSLSISQTKFTLRTSKTFDVQGTLRIDGVTASEDPLVIQRGSTSIVKIRDRKDFEVCDGSTSGLRLRTLPQTGTIATIGSVTSNGNNYGASQTYTGVASTPEFEGIGATFTVTTNGSGGIDAVAIVSGGSGYEVDEIVKIAGNLIGGTNVTDDITFPVATISNPLPSFSRLDVISQDFVTRTDGKSFLSIDANGAETAWKINRGWSTATENYLTVFDSTATFMELDDCRVEGGELTSFPTTATITAFDRNNFKGSKTLVTIESDDNKVHMLEVTIVCASNGTEAHATITNSITSDNNLMDATVAVVGSNVNISLAKSSAATSSSNFTGRFTTTKVKA